MGVYGSTSPPYEYSSDHSEIFSYFQISEDGFIATGNGANGLTERPQNFSIQNLNSEPLIAVYWADAVRSTGNVTYQKNTSDLSRASDDVTLVFNSTFTATDLAVVTWNHVAAMNTSVNAEVSAYIYILSTPH